MFGAARDGGSVVGKPPFLASADGLGAFAEDGEVLIVSVEPPVFPAGQFADEAGLFELFEPGAGGVDGNIESCGDAGERLGLEMLVNAEPGASGAAQSGEARGLVGGKVCATCGRWPRPARRSRGRR